MDRDPLRLLWFMLPDQRPLKPMLVDALSCIFSGLVGT